MKVLDLKTKQKLILCFLTRKRNLIHGLIMLIIKIIELDVVFIILLVKKSLIIIVKDVVVKQEDSVFLNVNVHKLVKSEK